MTERQLGSGVQEPDYQQLEEIDIEELKEGSTMLCLETAVAIQVGKVAPIGYDRAADFFTHERGRTTPAHNAWFLAEAEVAGRIKDLQRDFPDVPRLAAYIVDHMKKTHPSYIANIMQRIARPDYSLNGARGEQREASEIARELLSTPTQHPK